MPFGEWWTAHHSYPFHAGDPAYEISTPPWVYPAAVGLDVAGVQTEQSFQVHLRHDKPFCLKPGLAANLLADGAQAEADA